MVVWDAHLDALLVCPGLALEGAHGSIDRLGHEQGGVPRDVEEQQ
jgi:hypothetical protein